MPREIWSDAIRRAHFEAWVDEADMPDWIEEEQIDGFAARWGGLSTDAFKQALQNGDAKERLFAIFALGYLAPPNVEVLLIPFLTSPIRKERWASAIALGSQKDERVFPVLQDLLLENMAQHLPQDSMLIQRVYHAVEEANQYGTWEQTVQKFLLEDIAQHSLPERKYIDRYSNAVEKASQYFRQRTWECLTDPTTVDAWSRQMAVQEGYRWYLIHRLTITRLFGSWGNSQAILTLRQALQMCQELEQRFGLSEVLYDDDTWSFFKNLLVETLMQLERNA